MSESADESLPSDTQSAPETPSEPAPPRRQGSGRSGLSALRAAALEAGLVVLGVVLAFGVNEWRKAQVEEERSRAALDAVAVEVETNRAALAASVSYHSEKMMGLQALHRKGETASPRFFEQGFVHPAQVLSNAWDAAIATDAIRGWDYDELLTVSRLYADQEHYRVQSQGVSEVIYHFLLEEGTDGVAARSVQLGSIISSFWWRECQLLAEYSEVLPVLGREAPPVSSACPEAREEPRKQGKE